MGLFFCVRSYPLGGSSGPFKLYLRANQFGLQPIVVIRNLFRAVVAVPRAEIDRREEEWQKARGKKRKEAAKR